MKQMILKFTRSSLAEKVKECTEFPEKNKWQFVIVLKALMPPGRRTWHLLELLERQRALCLFANSIRKPKSIRKP